jgi:hypothetical protein
MPLKWTKKFIAAEPFEAADAWDVNGDGVVDIVCGEYWYEGPSFTRRHPICSIGKAHEYYDDFCVIPMDINGDGRRDFVSCGWFSKSLHWRECPADLTQPWKTHLIWEGGPVETARAWDVDGDGELEIVANAPGSALIVHKLILDANGKGTGKFSSHTVFSGKQAHGLGFGDINGDGRGDFVLPFGWLEAPGDPYRGEWKLHAEFDLGSASVPIIVADINGDGLNDLIVGQAHDYGLDWYEQKFDGRKRTWIKHPIDPFNSQYHDMQWIDIDGDGKCELVTGKRFRAHNHGDNGGLDDFGVMYFKWNGESFSKQMISFGPLGQGSGCGIQFALRDLRGTGRLDLIAPGKDGLYVFYNEGM